MFVLIALFARKLENLLDQFCFNHFYIVKVLDHSEDGGGCRSAVLVSSLEILFNGCFQLRLNVPGFTLKCFNDKRRNIHLLHLNCDGEMC